MPETVLCECGCGQPALVATNTRAGYRKGDQLRFAQGHAGRDPERRARAAERARRGTPQERFLRHVEEDDNGCRIWVGRIGLKGYGLLKIDGRELTVHRLAYEWWVGPLLDGQCVHHRCQEKRCTNPDHLQAVS